MTQQQNKTYFSLGKNKYDCKCIQCDIELTELKEKFPEGTPIPIKCDKCKNDTDHEIKLKVFKDRFNIFLNEIPEIYRDYIKFDLRKKI